MAILFLMVQNYCFFKNDTIPKKMGFSGCFKHKIPHLSATNTSKWGGLFLRITEIGPADSLPPFIVVRNQICPADSLLSIY